MLCICFPQGTLELQSWDLVGDLRAEVGHWWEGLQQQGATQDSPSCQPGLLRMITQGQELTADLDEKPLADLGFKDLQVGGCSVS